MRAVIVGSTGLVGSELLSKLLKDDAFESVVSVSRRPPSASHPKLKKILIPSLEDMPSHSEELAGDLYFCCLGTTIKSAGSQENFRKVDHDAVLEFAKVAHENKAKAFVVISAQGASSSSRIFYNKVKGEVEDELKEMGLPRLVIMKPSLLIGERKEKRSAEAMLIKAYKTLHPVLPDMFAKRVGTKVPLLADQMLQLAKASPGPEVEVIEAKDIGSK